MRHWHDESVSYLKHRFRIVADETEQPERREPGDQGPLQAWKERCRAAVGSPGVFRQAGLGLLIVVSLLLFYPAVANAGISLNRVTVGASSWPITEHAASAQVGGFFLSWPGESALQAGETIVIDLDCRPAQAVTLAQTIDFEISFGGDGGRWVNATIPVKDAPVTDPTASANPELNGVYFRVYGEAGTSRITVTVMGDPGDYLSAGNNYIDDKILLEFLNGMSNDEYTTDGVWIDDNGDDIYDVPATTADTTLYLDASRWDQPTISAHLYSTDHIFLSPVVEIAHIAAAGRTSEEKGTQGPNDLAIAKAGMGRATVAANSWPLNDHPLSTRGGGLSLEWQTHNILQIGNTPDPAAPTWYTGTIAIIDLPRRSATEFVALARTVDFEISPRGSCSKWDRVGLGNIPTGGLGASSPLSDPNLSSNTIGVGVCFRVYGEAGSSRITLLTRGNPNDAVVVGPFADSRLILEFLVGRTNVEYARDGIWIEGTTPGVYNVPGVKDDAILYLDVSAWDQPSIIAHIASEHYLFSSSTIEIAHLVPFPEMDVQCNGLSISNGDTTPAIDDHTDFGSAYIPSGVVSRTFTIENIGNVALNLTGTPHVLISGSHAADFTVTTQPTSPVALGGGTTTFQVDFTPSAVGLRSAVVSIANDDGNENPYEFTIQGTGLPADITVTPVNLTVSEPSGSDTFTITLVSQPTGGASVSIPITSSDPSVCAVSPNPLMIANADWSTGAIVTVTAVNDHLDNPGDQRVCTVQTGDPSSPDVTYDALGAEDVVDVTVTVLDDDDVEISIHEKVSGTDIPYQSTYDLGTVDANAFMLLEFTLSNSGTTDLLLTGDPLVAISGPQAAEFRVVLAPTSPVSAGGATDFIILFDCSSTDPRSATVMIANTDSDEAPYVFDLVANQSAQSNSFILWTK